jgi:glycosyltransferase involved in cell wall biosynthesis
MEDKTPRVSIGMPVYNGENYLANALDSLLHQTFMDLEIVISDNASTDTTQEICEAYARMDARIRYHRNDTNLGPGPNYNRAFLLSRGEYFQWAAHDDLFAPDYIEKCVRVLDNDPSVVLCHAKTCFIDSQGTVTGSYDHHKPSDSSEPHIRFGALIMNVKCFEIFGVIRSSAMRQTPLQGSFGHADGILLVRLGLLGRFHEIPEFLFFNRDHADKSIYKYSTYRDYAVFYDPKNAGKILLPRWRMGYEYAKAIAGVQLGVRDRFLCSVRLLVWAAVFWKSLLANIFFAGVQLLRGLLPVRKASPSIAE